MFIDVGQDAVPDLVKYSSISIAFDVEESFDVETSADGLKHTLSARRVPSPYVKDYDAVEGPLQWGHRFNLANWGFFSAFLAGRRVGGAAVAHNTPASGMLEGRTDLALLWDIRVAQRHRRDGVGSALFAAAETWAGAQGCRLLKIETQNINIAACRFYARSGCILRGVHRNAYPQFPDEIQLLWHKDITRGTSG